MPCTGEENERNYYSDNENFHIRMALDKTTRLLCDVLRQMEGKAEIKGELKEWWDKHKEFDKRRGR